MNILEALFGSTDLYQKAQARKKSRIERKQVLENRGFGSMPQEYETKEESVNGREDFEEVRKAVKRENCQNIDSIAQEGLSDVKELLKKADEILRVYDEIQKSVAEQGASLDAVQKSMEERSSSIEEKIHSENVKSYRNVQAALDDMNKGVAKEDSLVLLVSGLRTQLKCVTWFSVITLLVLIAYILFSLGVF